MKKILAVAGFVSALVFAPLANAAPVTLWSYSVTLDWTGASFTAGGGTPLVGASTISWGATGGDHTISGLPAANSRSGLEITNSPAVGNVATNGGPAATNTVTHFNNAILASFASLDQASLVTTLTLTPLLPAPGPVIGPVAAPFTVDFTETFNSAPCGFVSATTCDDIFVITLGDLDFSFDFDGFTYDVSIFETTSALAGLSDAACLAAGALPGCVGFQTPEGAFTPASFAFTISTVLLPEPGVLALLGLGLVGLGLARRKTH